MSDYSNAADECLECGDEYDALLEVQDGGMMQTQGKANVCVTHREHATFVFLHYAEKYL